jgi:hypothetical protein
MDIPVTPRRPCHSGSLPCHVYKIKNSTWILPIQCRLRDTFFQRHQPLVVMVSELALAMLLKRSAALQAGDAKCLGDLKWPISAGAAEAVATIGGGKMKFNFL